MPKRPIQSICLFLRAAGVEVVLNSDQLYADDHPFVVERPELFRDISRDVIETATAGPGERRAAVRPR